MPRKMSQIDYDAVPMIACACGCGTMIKSMDRSGISRKFSYHHATRIFRKAKSYYLRCLLKEKILELKECACGCGTLIQSSRRFAYGHLKAISDASLMIECGCGCGNLLKSIDRSGISRRFIEHHQLITRGEIEKRVATMKLLGIKPSVKALELSKTTEAIAKISAAHKRTGHKPSDVTYVLSHTPEANEKRVGSFLRTFYGAENYGWSGDELNIDNLIRDGVLKEE